MASAAQLALGLDRSYGTTLRRLRSGSIGGAERRGRRWQVPTYAVQDAYAERADAYFAAGRAIPLDAHYPDPRLAFRFTYQFVYTVRLTFEEGDTLEVTDFSWLITVEPGERKPSSRELRRRLIETLDAIYLHPEPEELEAYAIERTVTDVELLDAHVVRASRRTR